MTSKLNRISHRQVVDALPAFIRGKLSSELQRQIQAHIVNCTACASLHRQELNLSGLICEPMAGEEILLTSQRRETNRMRLMQRIKQNPSHPGAAQDNQCVSSMRSRFPRVVSVAASMAAVVLGGMLWVQYSYSPAPESGATYLTRSSITAPQTAPTDDTYRVVFQPEETPDSIRHLLSVLEAEVINGPSATGVYTLAFSQPALSNEQRLAQLRREPAILLAERSVHRDR
ncbi:MAG: zf-HC2 domain-containing protein [Halioglobus sp.]|nr:zf-HC2 domain-containing protein [Halioglobus sp.]